MSWEHRSGQHAMGTLMRFRMMLAVSLFALLGSCAITDAASVVGTTYTHSFGDVFTVHVDPTGSLVAVSGNLAPSLLEPREYGLELISLDDGSRRLVSGLPEGLVAEMAWTPDGSTLVAVVERLFLPGVEEGCGNPAFLLLVSRDGAVKEILDLSPVLDVRGIAIVDGSVAVAGGVVAGRCDEEHLWRIDLTSGAAADLGVTGAFPERAGHGVAFLDLKQLRWLDLETGETRDLAPGLGALFLGGAASPLLVFRGYDEATGERAGIYRVNVTAAEPTPELLLETALNRISLDDSGNLLVGFLPQAGPRSGRIVAIDLTEVQP